NPSGLSQSVRYLGTSPHREEYMIDLRTCGYSLLLAGFLGWLGLSAWPAEAQQQAPLPPGSPLLGRPDTEAARKLAPVAPPPLPTAADKLPTAKLKAPQGFHIELYASGIDNARTLRLGDKGTVFVSSRIKDKIHAIVERNGKREVKVL